MKNEEKIESFLEKIDDILEIEKKLKFIRILVQANSSSETESCYVSNDSMTRNEVRLTISSDIALEIFNREESRLIVLFNESVKKLMSGDYKLSPEKIKERSRKVPYEEDDSFDIES